MGTNPASGGGTRLMTDAADDRPSGLGGKDIGHVVAVEPGLGDANAGQALGGIQVGQPIGFGHRAGRVELGLDMYGGDDVVQGGIGPEIRRQIVAADRAVVAVAERDRPRVAEPRVVVMVEVPEMLVRIDDRQAGGEHGTRRLVTLIAVSWMSRIRAIEQPAGPAATGAGSDWRRQADPVETGWPPALTFPGPRSVRPADSDRTIEGCAATPPWRRPHRIAVSCRYESRDWRRGRYGLHAEPSPGSGRHRRRANHR